MTETPRWLGDQTRRSVLRKGAATGILALSPAVSTGVAGAQDGSAEAAMNAFRFYPGASFDVVTELETETTVELLQVNDEPVSEISRPDEWTAHVIRYGIGEESGITTLLFTRNHRMSADETGTLGVDASTLNRELNLLSVSVESDGAPSGLEIEEDPATEEDENDQNESEDHNGGE